MLTTYGVHLGLNLEFKELVDNNSGYYGYHYSLDSRVKEYAFVIANEKTKVFKRVKDLKLGNPHLQAWSNSTWTQL